MAGREPVVKDHEDVLLAALAGLLPACEPDPDVRDRLRQRLLARVAVPRMHVLRADEGQWQPVLPGIRIKTLRRDEREGTQTALWSMEPGAKVPPHPHHHEEECLILEGSVLHGGVEYFAGDYLLAEAGLQHEVFIAPKGALLMIRSELVPMAARLPYLDPS